MWWAAGFFVMTGIVSVLLPNTLFMRMTPIVWWDFALWPLGALLAGAFMGVRDAIRSAGTACSTAAGAGGVGAFLGFACPQCNHLLILLMGTGGVLTFVEPYRLYIGIVGELVLVLALGLVWRSYRKTVA